jgi:cysteinyl-tRNA synthetase
LRDILEKGYSGLAVRYLLIATHYRQQLNFTFEGLEAARNALERYNDFIVNLEDYPGGNSNGQAGQIIDRMLTGFEEALDDDLNISAALGKVFDFIRDINKLKAENNLSADERDQALQAIRKVDTVLNFRRREQYLDAEIEALIQKRTEARKRKDFALADKIRDDLKQMGIILEDTPQGVKWKRKV